MKLFIVLVGMFFISCNSHTKINNHDTTVVKNNSTQCKSSKVDVEDVSIDNFYNTLWYYEYSDGCRDFYKFTTDNKFTFYSCEASDTIFGTFHTIKDTLITESQYRESDKYFSIASEQRSSPTIWKYLIKRDRLIPVSTYKKNIRKGHLEEIDSEYDANYFYIKE